MSEARTRIERSVDGYLTLWVLRDMMRRLQQTTTNSVRAGLTRAVKRRPERALYSC